MGAAIGQILGNAIGVAISPVPIIALILMLFSHHAVRNSISFLVGWLLGLGIAITVVLMIGIDTSGGPSTTAGVIKVVIGALLLALAVKQWKGRPQDGETPALPGWMASVDDLAPAKALALGALLSGVNPKNLGLTIAAAATITTSGLTASEEAVVAAVYVLLASVTLIVPVVAYLIARNRVAPVLDSLKNWLTVNNATVMVVLFTVLGAKVLGDGISILF